MKTHILRLDPHDNVVSACDKMGWGKTGRILLVWPDRGRVLNRRLDLVLLQRQSRSMGAQLALLTEDPDVCYYARQIGVPVFKTLLEAQNAHWRVERGRRSRLRLSPHEPTAERPDLTTMREDAHPQRPAWLQHPFVRLGFFTLGVLALLSIAAVLLPGAEVTLAPQSLNQEITLTLHANSRLDRVNLSGYVPTYPVTVIVEGRDSLPTRGMISVPDKPATGQVSFTNLTERLIQVPADSVVRTLGTNPIRFATTRAVSVPAGPGQTVTISVYAITPGTSGNLPARSLVAVEGLLGLNLIAVNPKPTRGGSYRTVPAPTKEDRILLFNQLEESLQQTALSELLDRLAPGGILFTTTVTLTNVLEESYEPVENEPSENLNLNLRLEYQAQITTPDDLATLATAVLDANIPHGFSPVLGTLIHTNITDPIMESKTTASWLFQAQRTLQAQLNETQAINLALGLSPTQAAKQLTHTLALDRPPHITLTPAWWPRLPILPFRISITNGQ